MKKLIRKIVFLSAFSVILNSAATGFPSCLSYKPDIISVSAEEVNDAEWKTAYADFLKNSDLDQYINFDGDKKFTLAYIDDNDIPELVIMHGPHFFGPVVHGGVSAIFTYANGSVQQISKNELDDANFGSSGKLYYFEKDGIIKSVYSYNGGDEFTYLENTSYFKIENNKAIYLFGKLTSYGAYKTDETTYHVGSEDSEVSEAEYKSCLSQYNESNEKEIYYDDIFEINDENIAKYLSVEDDTKKEATDSGQCGKNIEWAFYDDTNTLIISGSGDMYNYSGINISGIDADSPDYFKYAENIKNIIIEDGITSIGNGAFQCYMSDKAFLLDSIVIPDSVKTIGDSAFCDLHDISKVLEAVEKSKVENIGTYAFHRSGGTVEKFKIPDTVKFIGEGALAYTGIEALVVPKDLSYENIANAGFGYAADNIHGTYYGYRGSDAEKYVNDMNNTDLSSTSMLSIDLKFIALDEEETPENNDDSSTNTDDNSSNDNNSSVNNNNNNVTNATNNNGSQSVSNASNNKTTASNNNNITKSPDTGNSGISLLLCTALSAISIAYILRKKK